MALLTSELYRIKYELGFNVLTVGAEPYIGFSAIFEQVIQPYMSAGDSTTSSTAITVSDPSTSTLATITLADATGFAAASRMVVDVDDYQEAVTVRSISGSDVSAYFAKSHAAGYPVTVEGGESILREILHNIASVKKQLAATYGEGAIKKVDEIEFYNTNGSTFGLLGSQLWFWRDELAAALGIRSMWSERSGSAQILSVY